MMHGQTKIKFTEMCVLLNDVIGCQVRTVSIVEE